MCEDCQEIFDNCPKLKYICQRINREESKLASLPITEKLGPKSFALRVWESQHGAYFENFYQTSSLSDDDSDSEVRTRFPSKFQSAAFYNGAQSTSPTISSAPSTSSLPEPASERKRVPKPPHAKKTYPKWYVAPSGIYISLPNKLWDSFASWDDQDEFDALWIARDLENEKRRKGSKNIDPSIWVIPEKFTPFEAYFPRFEEHVVKPRKPRAKQLLLNISDSASSSHIQSSSSECAEQDPSRTQLAFNMSEDVAAPRISSRDLE